MFLATQTALSRVYLVEISKKGKFGFICQVARQAQLYTVKYKQDTFPTKNFWLAAKLNRSR